MARTPTLASRSPGSPTCSPSPVRRALRCCRTCRSRSPSMWSGSPIASATCAMRGKTTIEATIQAQEQWVEHVNEVANTTLFPTANSWYMGANIAGKPRAFLPYLDTEGVGGYRRKCDEVAASGYSGFELTSTRRYGWGRAS